jgi:glyoxylase-like metal-dependent hydrolase (beta-lactamase superfamily II)
LAVRGAFALWQRVTTVCASDVVTALIVDAPPPTQQQRATLMNPTSVEVPNYAPRHKRQHPQTKTIAAMAAIGLLGLLYASPLQAGGSCTGVGCSTDASYANMPEITPIGPRTMKYLDIPDEARGPAIDPAKGYRLQTLGRGLYMVTENVYQSMFMVYEDGVVVIDAPPSLGAFLPKAIAEITDKPITHIIYSHAHADHIAGARSLGGHPIIIAHAETKRLLERAHDANRPVPTKTFTDHYTLKVGSQTLELSYHGNGHEPGNIFIYAPEQKTLMVVDVIFPGWMPFRRLALAQDIPGYFAQVDAIKSIDFTTLVSGHVARTGTKDDVELQSEFINDLKAAAGKALQTTKPGEELNPLDMGNPWAYFDNYIDRVAVQCVNTLAPKWSSKLAAFDVFIWDQCYTMEQSLRID